MHISQRFLFTASSAAILLALGTAHAGVVTTSPEAAGLSGGSTFSFSSDMMEVLDTTRATVTPTNPIVLPTITRDSDGFYSNVSVFAPASSVTYDDSSYEISGLGTSSGLLVSVPLMRVVTLGGFLTITDLHTDFNSRTVFASISGANGLGTLTDFALWRFNDWSSQTSGKALTTTISGLSITNEGFSAMVQSLGLVQLGKAALMAVTDYGTITTTLSSTVLAGPAPAWHVTSVPEPATYALMGIGLFGMGLVRRQRKAQASRSH